MNDLSVGDFEQFVDRHVQKSEVLQACVLCHVLSSLASAHRTADELWASFEPFEPRESRGAVAHGKHAGVMVVCNERFPEFGDLIIV